MIKQEIVLPPLKLLFSVKGKFSNWFFKYPIQRLNNSMQIKF